MIVGANKGRDVQMTPIYGEQACPNVKHLGRDVFQQPYMAKRGGKLADKMLVRRFPGFLD